MTNNLKSEWTLTADNRVSYDVCATEGCESQAVGHFEVGGVRSRHCQPCLNAIQPNHSKPMARVEVKAVEIEDIIEHLLDAQQDINLAANENMDQSLCDASELIDRVEVLLRRIILSKSLSTQQPMGEVRVKPLEWIERKYGRLDGESIIGHYRVDDAYSVDTASGVKLLPPSWKGPFDSSPKEAGSVEDCKAAAQEDYRQRILSTLHPNQESGE